MSDVLMVVPSGGILANPQKPGYMSFRFLAVAKVDYKYCSLPYGVVMRVDDGHEMLWHVSVGKTSGALINGRGEDEMLTEALKSLPDCVIVVAPGDLDVVRARLTAAAHSVAIHDYHGALDIS